MSEQEKYVIELKQSHFYWVKYFDNYVIAFYDVDDTFSFVGSDEVFRLKDHIQVLSEIEFPDFVDQKRLYC